jgi:hypothetical protein
MKPKYQKLQDGIWPLYVAQDVYDSSYQIWVTKYARNLWQWSVFSMSGKAVERGKATSLVRAKSTAEKWLTAKLNPTENKS